MTNSMYGFPGFQDTNLDIFETEKRYKSQLHNKPYTGHLMMGNQLILYIMTRPKNVHSTGKLLICTKAEVCRANYNVYGCDKVKIFNN